MNFPKSFQPSDTLLSFCPLLIYMCGMALRAFHAVLELFCEHSVISDSKCYRLRITLNLIEDLMLIRKYFAGPQLLDGVKDPKVN
jgi:hypothetical protein